MADNIELSYDFGLIADNIELSYDFGLIADNSKRYALSHIFIIAG